MVHLYKLCVDISIYLNRSYLTSVDKYAGV